MNEVEKHYGLPDDAEAAAKAAHSTASDLRGKAEEAIDQVSGWARERYDDASTWAADSLDQVSDTASRVGRRSASEIGRGRDSVERFVEENPVMVGVVGLAAGLLIGALLPRTRREDAYFGRYADEAREQGLRYAQGLAEQGRTLVEENLIRPAAAAAHSR